jgi:hypothetical protein
MVIDVGGVRLQPDLDLRVLTVAPRGAGHNHFSRGGQPLRKGSERNSVVAGFEPDLGLDLKDFGGVRL